MCDGYAYHDRNVNIPIYGQVAFRAVGTTCHIIETLTTQSATLPSLGRVGKEFVFLLDTLAIGRESLLKEG